MRLCSLLLLAFLATAPMLAQTATPQPPASGTAGALTPQQVDREALLKQAGEQLRGCMRTHDCQDAEIKAAFAPALAKYPDDARVLSIAGTYALLCRDYPTAEEQLTRVLGMGGRYPWPTRVSLLQIYAELGQWSDFNRGLEELRTAKKSGNDPQLAQTSGFTIDTFAVNGELINAVFYPLMASQYHTLYRFYLPPGTVTTVPQQAATNTPGTADRCKDPKFQPYIDLESDDIDQEMFKKSHPDLVAKGGREYSLDTYPGPCSQGLIRFYDGEPTYETLRADLIKTLTKKPAKP